MMQCADRLLMGRDVATYYIAVDGAIFIVLASTCSWFSGGNRNPALFSAGWM
jgi:hypothetical protein